MAFLHAMYWGFLGYIRNEKRISKKVKQAKWTKIKLQADLIKKKYYKLLDKTGNHLKKQLEKIIYDKLEYLKSGAVTTPYKNIKSGAVSSIIYSGIGTQYKNAICKVTGLDISTQKTPAFY